MPCAAGAATRPGRRTDRAEGMQVWPGERGFCGRSYRLAPQANVAKGLGDVGGNGGQQLLSLRGTRGASIADHADRRATGELAPAVDALVDPGDGGEAGDVGPMHLRQLVGV